MCEILLFLLLIIWGIDSELSKNSICVAFKESRMSLGASVYLKLNPFTNSGGRAEQNRGSMAKAST